MQEFCNGGTLRDAIVRGIFTTMPRRWHPIMAVLRGVAEGMTYMHGRRICHGDLNPANVLVKVRCLQLPFANEVSLAVARLSAAAYQQLGGLRLAASQPQHVRRPAC